MLPVGVHTLVSEKEQHLRVMMKMQVGQGGAARHGDSKCGRHHTSQNPAAAYTHTTPHTTAATQGLSDSVYHAVNYAWHLLLYCAFVAVFCIFGGLIGLKLFTLNSYSLQVMLHCTVLRHPALPRRQPCVLHRKVTSPGCRLSIPLPLFHMDTTHLLDTALQAVFYFLWGLQLTSWTTYFSALWSEARPAVLLAVIWIIISG